MSETRKLAAILVADVVGYSRLAGADEEGTLARIRALRGEVVDPVLAANRGRVANTAGDSLLVEFGSAVDALRAATDIQRAMAIRNADFVADKRIEFRIGVHVGDVMVEHDGDLRGDGVNIAARLEGIAKPGGVCLSEDAYRQVKGRIDAGFADLVDPVLAANRGRVANTAGDSLLVEFGSAVDALRAATDIQRAMAIRNADFVADKRIEFRIGVHVGDVMVEHDGDLRGDGVNIAARLEGIAKPGGVCLSEDAYRQVKGRIDAGFADLGEQKLKNIADPVRAYSLQLGAPASGRLAAPKPRSKLAPLGLALAALLIAVSGVAWYLSVANHPASVATNAPAPVASNAAPAEPKHLSIVVLPFTNLSGDPAQDYFADGVTENLTTDLSRIRNSFVIARNTAITFKGKNLDAKEIGKELGVRYVLEGSAQRDQNRVRVNAQLVDAESGAQLWADRFEEDVADLFKLQDEVVARLVNSLGNELVKAEAEKGARSKNPDAVDLTMRGRVLVSQLLSQRRMNEDNDENIAARTLFDQALKIDPNEADALAGEAATYWAEYFSRWKNSETDYEAKIIGQADRAIALAPGSELAYAVKGWYLNSTHRWDQAIRAADAGLAIDPNSASLYAARGRPEANLGRFAQAKSDAQQAMRLSPRDPFIGAWHLDLGSAELGLGHYDAAIEEFHKADDSACCGAGGPLSLAAAYALAGKMDEAKSALAEARRIEPKLTIKEAENLPGVWIEGLRKAGLPEE